MVNQSILIQVKVKPNAQASAFRESENGIWQAEVKSSPVDGKANQELIQLVATHFNCRKADVSIKRGASGRLKLIQIVTA